MINLMIIIGGITAVAGGFLLAGLIMYFGAYFSGWATNKLIKNLKKTYHSAVIGYWLRRLEKEGTHCFMKSENK